MALFDSNLPRNANRPLSPPGTVTFSSGVASKALTAASPTNLKMTLTQNSALTLTGMVEGQEVNLRVTHSGGTWTLSVNSQDVGLSASSGQTEWVTLWYNGSSFDGYAPGVLDFSA